MTGTSGCCIVAPFLASLSVVSFSLIPRRSIVVRICTGCAVWTAYLLNVDVCWTVILPFPILHQWELLLSVVWCYLMLGVVLLLQCWLYWVTVVSVSLMSYWWCQEYHLGTPYIHLFHSSPPSYADPSVYTLIYRSLSYVSSRKLRVVIPFSRLFWSYSLWTSVL